MTKISFTGQNLVSAFDPEIALLYFDFLTRKNTELDFDVSCQMYIYLLASKWFKNHLNPMLVVQDIAEIPQGVKSCETFLLLFLIASTLLHFIFSFNHFKSSSIIQLSS